MRFTARQGRLCLQLRVCRQGGDLQVLLGGGTAHLGAVALAYAPASGAQAQGRLLVLPGHREDVLALRTATALADGLGCAVCVSAGIHYPAITREEIAVVEALADVLTQRCLMALRKQTSDPEA